MAAIVGGTPSEAARQRGDNPRSLVVNRRASQIHQVQALIQGMQWDHLEIYQSPNT